MLDATTKQRAGQMAMTTVVTRASGAIEERVQSYWSHDPRRRAIVARLLARGDVLSEQQVYTESTPSLFWRLVKGLV